MGAPKTRGTSEREFVLTKILSNVLRRAKRVSTIGGNAVTGPRRPIKSFMILFFLFAFTLVACDDRPLNQPYPKSEDEANIFYTSFSERPKTFDPAQSYSSNEYLFLAQIYEPPLQYDYLKRPYTLIPLTASSMPEQIYLDAENNPLPNDVADEKVAYTIYTIHIKPGIYYQPHPALAKDGRGEYLYHHLSKDYLENANIQTLSDFPKTGTRELIAEDYVYQIKRLAHPETQSPILGFISTYIVGLDDYADLIQNEYQKLMSKKNSYPYIDLHKYPLPSVQVIDRYTYQIKIKGKYPQFLYWLAMPFFSPMPWEADLFDSQPGMRDHNITLEWYPLGTGPYMLIENNPNRQMILSKNPNFHAETYPTEGMPEDMQKGLLKNAGKPLPFIDKIIFRLEKESDPRWNKFLQGYYDSSSVSSDSFDQAIHIDKADHPELTDEMKQRGIILQTSISPSIFYMGFNMLDDVVGGYTDQARKLRQALSIAVDFDEFINIFLNGRAKIAQGPIPIGVFGYDDTLTGINNYVYEVINGQPKRKTIEFAKQLLIEAGYPNGRDEKTGQVLILNYDVPLSSGPDDKEIFDWMRKQYAKLGIQLNIRATQYNRFQENMRTGNIQIFSWGWNADYPDPENFLFLLYGPNSKVKHQGENAANYDNPEFDALFIKMKNMPNGPERSHIIQQMLEIARNDAPWIWGYHPEYLSLLQSWVGPQKINAIYSSTIKYMSIDPKDRDIKRNLWNKPIFWPLYLIFGLMIILIIPVYIKYWKKEHKHQ